MCSNSFRRFIAHCGKQHVTVCHQLFVLVLMVIFVVLGVSQTDGHYSRSNYREQKRKASCSQRSWKDANCNLVGTVILNVIFEWNDIGKCLWNQHNNKTNDIDGCMIGSFNFSRELV